MRTATALSSAAGRFPVLDPARALNAEVGVSYTVQPNNFFAIVSSYLAKERREGLVKPRSRVPVVLFE